MYKDSSGQQQVLPLDSIYRRSLPEWSRSVKYSFLLRFVFVLIGVTIVHALPYISLCDVSNFSFLTEAVFAVEKLSEN